MRMRFAVGIDQAVTAEVVEARDTFRTVIAAIRPIPIAILIQFAERLVHPIPDATALCHRFVFEYVPVFFQAANTVTHRMHIFTEDKRTVDFRFLLVQIFFDYVYAAVHAAIDVGIVVLFGTFVLYGAVLLDRFQPVVGTFEVDAVAGFVAQRPDYDAGMVLGTFVHPAGAVHMGREPGTVFSQRFGTVSHSVRFDVGFVDHIEAVFVAKFVP